MRRWSAASGMLLWALALTTGCGREGRDGAEMERIEIDGEPVALGELYPATCRPFTVRPIGVVVNDRHPGEGDFGITGGDVSEIHLYPGMARFMRGLEDETSLLILWQFDRPGPIRSVFVRGWDGKEVGPFASRTCNRPTPIGATVVDLLEVDGTRLVVRGLDAYDRTPVLDIKVSMKSLRESGPFRPHAGAR